jgi:cell division protein FtsI (penicillin-binding protein 3)
VEAGRAEAGRAEAGRAEAGRAGAGRIETGGPEDGTSRRPRGRARRPRRPVRLARPVVRLRLGMVLLIFLFSLFAGRLVQIQGIDAHAFSELADTYDAATEVRLAAPRGEIRDREGAPLAQTVDAVMLVADPRRTADDAPRIAAVVEKHTDESYLSLMAALRKPGTHFVYVARQIPQEAADAVLRELRRLKLAGVYQQPDPLRIYPSGDVAANLVGFVGRDGEALAGVEMAFDGRLSGTDGHATYVTDRLGTRIPLADSSVIEPEAGDDIALTIDEDLQFYTQRRLRQAVEDTGSISGAAVVLDPRTSELLALADFPTYDPNDPGDAPSADRGSRAVEEVYEPGSVAKVLTAAALVDARKVTPQTRMTLPPLLQRGPDTIKDWFGHGEIRLTFAGALAQSSNIGVAMAAEQMESAELYEYLRAFGLGEKTHLGLAGETAGLVPTPENWLPITRDTIAFGQGMSVNAVQMAAGIGAIANGGTYIEPSVVKGYLGTRGAIEPVRRVERRQVVSPHAAAAVTQMMEMVTRDGGTAPAAAIEGYRVAGKTGTAQRVDPEGGGYATGGFTVSFAGFAPADDPRIVTYVVLQKPSSSVGGGTGAGPVFRDITSFALQKYAVPPTGTRAPELPLDW